MIHNISMAAAGSSAVEAVDPYFKNVSLLLHGDGTNGAQNNTILDSSTNNFTVTRAGNATQGTFSPFSRPAGEWSAQLATTSDYLAISDATPLDLGTGDFTIEGWVNVKSGVNSNCGILGKRDTSTFSGNDWRIAFDTSTMKVNLAHPSYGSGSSLATTPAISYGTWVHFAFCRSGTNLYCFANGVLGDTITSFNYNFDNAYPLLIGRQVNPTYNFLGGISNIRILKGTALYTSAFSAPTTPLTAITNTQLLCCQDYRFKDNSANNFTVVANGTPSASPVSPFAPSSSYSAAVNGGSLYFDGTGDYASVPANTAFAFGTGDLTVEAWFCRASSDNDAVVVDMRGTVNSNDQILIAVVSGTLYANDGASWVINGGTAPPANTWNHIAVTRQSSSLKLFVNGVQVGSTYSCTKNFSGYSIGIGDSLNIAGYTATGYISDVRIIKGTALYTTTFTPPTAPLTAITNTQLLLSGTNAAIYDHSKFSDIETFSSAKLSTVQKKFGLSSMLFTSATNDLLAINRIPPFNYANFTIEWWQYWIDGTGYQTPFDRDYSAIGGLLIQTSLNNARYIVYASSEITCSEGSAPNAGQWYHYAIVRNGNTISMYRDGTLTGSGAFTGSISSAAVVSIGAKSNGGLYGVNGYIDDFRITNGVARYTTAFTPATTSFPNR